MPTVRSTAPVLFLASQLLASFAPGHVLCLHHDGGLTIERAALGAVRCDDASVPCVGGLGTAPSENHCHDAAIAQPGLARRVVVPAATDLAVQGARAVPALAAAPPIAVSRSEIQHGSPPQTRRSVVLRV